MSKIFSRRNLLRGLLALAVVIVLIQLVPVDRTNPPVEQEVAAPPEVRSVLARSCYDCHSHETVWPWYSRIAPVSWLVAHDVEEAREHLNFSTWNRLDAGKRAEALEEIWEEVSEGEMPLWYYLPLHPGARLSRQDLELLRGWTGGSSEGGRGRGRGRSGEGGEREEHDDD
jgi:hypothetical protein